MPSIGGVKSVSVPSPGGCEVFARAFLRCNLDTVLGCAALKPGSLASSSTRSLFKLY